jgi:hypothetical protein
MPTPFGALPSTEPLPNGRIQIKRGVGGDGPVNFNTGTPAGTQFPDNAGGFMQISYMTKVPCFWIVHSCAMAHGYADGAGWRRWDHGIRITPADADGIVLGCQVPHELYDNSTVEWRTVAGSTLFRLNPNTFYTAFLSHEMCSAGTAVLYIGQIWSRIVGRIVGEGVT